MRIEGHGRKVDIPPQPPQALVGCLASVAQVLGKPQIGDPRFRPGSGLELGSHQPLLFLVEPGPGNAIDEHTTEVEVRARAKPAVEFDRFVDGQRLRDRHDVDRASLLVADERTCAIEELNDGRLIEEVSTLLNGWVPVSLNGEAPVAGLELATDYIAALLESRPALSNSTG